MTNTIKRSSGLASIGAIAIALFAGTPQAHARVVTCNTAQTCNDLIAACAVKDGDFVGTSWNVSGEPTSGACYTRR
jgi:hypothetical protein